MRRFLTEVAAYLSDLGRATIRGWNAFFFSPADPTALGLIRVAVGLLAFWSLFVFGLDLHDYLSSTGWAEPGVIRSVEGPLAWSFWFLVPDDWLRPVWCVCLAILASFILGFYSRVAAVLSWMIVVSTVRRVPIALYGFDQVLSTLALYLALSGASGQAVSLDRFLKRWRQARARRFTDPQAWRTHGPPCDTRCAGSTDAHGLGQSGDATDPASPGSNLRHGWACETSGTLVVGWHRHLEDHGYW